MERTPFEQHCDKLDSYWDELDDFEKQFFEWEAVKELIEHYKNEKEMNLETGDAIYEYWLRDIIKSLVAIEDDLRDKMFGSVF